MKFNNVLLFVITLCLFSCGNSATQTETVGEKRRQAINKEEDLATQERKRFLINKEEDIATQERKVLLNWQSNYEMFDDELSELLTDLILSDKASMDYPFQVLCDSTSLHVARSKDGKLCLYSWVTNKGGTMLDYDNAFKYESNGKIKAFKKCPWYYDDAENYMGPPQEGEVYDTYYRKIFTVRIDGETFYLVNTFNQYSSGRGIETICAYTIEDDRLKTVELFKTNKEILDFILIDYDFITWANAMGGIRKSLDYLFSLEEETNTLYVPLVNNANCPDCITGRYLCYQLKGKYFEYVGVSGGYWLHPSLHEFQYLVKIVETDKFRVRIDCIGKDEYRYALWDVNKKMSSQPDLVLEGDKVEWSDRVGG